MWVLTPLVCFFKPVLFVLCAALVLSLFQLNEHCGLCLMPRFLHEFSSSSEKKLHLLALTIPIHQLPNRSLFCLFFLLACPTLGLDLNSPSYREWVLPLLWHLAHCKLFQGTCMLVFCTYLTQTSTSSLKLAFPKYELLTRKVGSEFHMYLPQIKCQYSVPVCPCSPGNRVLDPLELEL